MLAMRPPQQVLEPAAMRAMEPQAVAFLNVNAPTVAIEKEIRIPGPASEIRALVFSAETVRKAIPVVLFLHGGGFVQLSPETHAKFAKQLALGAGAVVLSLEYRLAPENPYPAGLEDCLTAFRWVRENAAALGGDPHRIAIAGDSAGGNLAAATILRLAAAGEPPPNAALFICAWLDLAMNTPSFQTFGPDDLIIDDTRMRFFRDCYAPRPAQWDDPFVSPLRGDLSGFPPTCIVVGAIDPLCDDGIAFAEKLRRAGRDVVLQRHEAMPHDFVILPMLDEATRASDAACEFLRQSLG